MLATLGESLGLHRRRDLAPGRRRAALRHGLARGRARAPRWPRWPTRTREQTFAAGQGLPGRVWAFRRPVWIAELSGDALRAGLVSGAAFPIALGDECVGVIELYASDAREPNAEVSAMFATVGGQLASYLARRRKRARARRAFDGADGAGRRARRRRPRGDRQRHRLRALGSARTSCSAATGSSVVRRGPGAREAFARMLAGEGVRSRTRRA